MKQKLTAIPIVVGALATVRICLENKLRLSEIRGKIKTTQITALFRSTRILKGVFETRSGLLSI